MHVLNSNPVRTTTEAFKSPRAVIPTLATSPRILRFSLLLPALWGAASAEIDQTTDPNAPFRQLKVLGPVQTMTTVTGEDPVDEEGTDAQKFTFGADGQVTRIVYQDDDEIEYQYKEGCFVKQQDWSWSRSGLEKARRLVHQLGPDCQVREVHSYDSEGEMTRVTRYRYSGTSMTTEEFNAPNARGEEQSAVTARECQGPVCTTTATTTFAQDSLRSVQAEQEVVTSSEGGQRVTATYISQTQLTVGGETSLVASVDERTTYNAQGWPVTITTKVFKKNLGLNVTSQTNLVYSDLDQYGNWRTRKETRTRDGELFSRKATSRTSTYR
jgi:hypothetical protein